MNPAVLIVMDGYGLREEEEGNAIKAADTPNLDECFSNWPFTRLKASGKAVGVPKGYQGSSEVGHVNIGAGRLVKQWQLRIDESIDDGSFFNKHQLQRAAGTKGELHVMGLLSDQGVHAHINHLFALLKFCSENDIEPVVHAVTDGRDTPPRSAKKYCEMLDKKLEQYGGRLGTITGRYYAMDRDERWDRTKLAYDAVNEASGEEVSGWREALESAYEAGEDDEFIQPRVIKGYEGVGEGDSIIFYNYRADRARQITKAFSEEDFGSFDRNYKDVNFFGMVEYYDEMPAPYLFEKVQPRNGLGEYVSKKGWKQYRIAETEKYAHVTYFFSGEHEEEFDGEERIVVPSPKVATYDEKPEMSAYEITEKCLGVLDEADLVVMNFANCDMVGHTGDFEATVQAVQAVDECIGQILDKTLELEGVVFITGDHGNAETMKTDEGGRVTSHTTAKVPLCIAGWQQNVSLKEGKLGDIAPTILTVLDEEVPDEMTGEVLIQ